jgi:hypothetical protein
MALFHFESKYFSIPVVNPAIQLEFCPKTNRLRAATADPEGFSSADRATGLVWL